MKSRTLLLSALLAASLTCSLCIGAEAEAPVDARFEQVDQIFAGFDRPGSPGCAVGIIQDGEFVYTNGYGMANLEHNIPMGTQSVNYIASTSKQFTALSVLMASRQGHLSLDDDIRKYIPEIPEYDKPITVRHLLHHTSGIRDYIGLTGLAGTVEDGYLPAEYVIDLLARQPALDFTPGTGCSYSNSGYFLLGQLIKRSTGMTLREFAEKNIFGPLGMTHTFFFDDHSEIVPNRAQGHDMAGEGSFKKSQTSFDLVGSGGLVTTVEDLFLYDQNFYHNVLEDSSETLLAEFLKPGSLDNGNPALIHNSDMVYGYGQVTIDYKGHQLVHHSGGYIGFSAQYLRFPEQELSVIALCNLYGANAGKLAVSVADLFLPESEQAPAEAEQAAPTAPEFIDVSAQALEAWTGRYWGPDYPMGKLEVVLRDGGLWVPMPEEFGPDVELKPTSESQFVSTGGRTPGGRFAFSTDEGGMTRLVIAIPAFGQWSLVQMSDFVPTQKDFHAISGGYYSYELDSRSHIFVEGGQLQIRIGYSAPSQLIAVDKDTYVASGNSISLERDEEGSISGFTLSSMGFKNIGFKRQ